MVLSVPIILSQRRGSQTETTPLIRGLELLMSNAYLSKDVMNAYMNHDIIKKGMEVLKWTTKNAIVYQVYPL